MDRQSLISTWLHSLQTHTSTTTFDHPNYYASVPSQLITTSLPQSFAVGSGHQILSSAIPLCLSTNYELLIVTCFIATSPSLKSLHDLLIQLSQKAFTRGRRIRVRICFSSVSLWQKLFQTASLDGKTWLPSEWPALGLPREEELRGLELAVKSVFVRPFSVMHPKFIVVDRKTVMVLSANISWEEWFEGAVVMKGEVCKQLAKFWEEVWGRGEGELPTDEILSSGDCASGAEQGPYSDGLGNGEVGIINRTKLPTARTQPATPIPTITLPSPHHTNPTFRPFSISPHPPPPTPLNLFLLHLFSAASSSITITTPNLTSPPVVSRILDALIRGVNVHIITSRRLMILEQLVTACTITEFEVWKLKRRYRTLLADWERRKGDEEAAVTQPGRLMIGWFKEGRGFSDQSARNTGEMDREIDHNDETYVVKTHLKMVIVDEEVTVLGSGNMDRASWWTSQELGVAFFSKEMAGAVWSCVEKGLEGRVDYVT